MTTFEKVKLGDVTEILSGGTPDSGNLDYWQDGDIPWATLPDLSKKYLLNTQRKITKSGLKNSAAKLLPANTVIFSSRATIGEISITKIETSTNQGSKNFVCHPDKIYYEFLYYFLRHNSKYIESLCGGTTYKEINKTVLSNLQVSLPDLKTQKNIASVLSAYDDLIENNEKRIKVLEEMAQRLHTEWFVKFKFPGHEKVKMVDSGTVYGNIPEGWEVKKLGDIAELIMGQSPTSSNYNFENEGLPFHQGVADFGYKYPTDRVYSTAGNKYAERGDLLFSVRAPVGRMNIANKKIILGRGLSAIRHKNGWQSLLCLMFDKKFTEKDMIGNGAIYKSVNKAELENLKFVVAPKAISEGLEFIVSKYFSEMEKLAGADINLSTTRDLLIPQLVTGKRELK